MMAPVNQPDRLTRCEFQLFPLTPPRHIVTETLPTVFPSPDGQHLLAFDTGGSTWLAGADVRRARQIPTQSEPALWGSWSRDGRHFAATDAAGVISLWELPAAEVRYTLAHPWGLRVLDLVLSPEGDQLAVAYENRELIVYDTETGARIVGTTFFDGPPYLFGFDAAHRLVYPLDPIP